MSEHASRSSLSAVCILRPTEKLSSPILNYAVMRSINQTQLFTRAKRKTAFISFELEFFFSSVNYHSLGGITHLPRSFCCLTVPVKQFLYLDLLLFATFDDLKYVYPCFVYSFQDWHTLSRYSYKIFVPFDNCSKTREIINLIGKTG